MSSLPFLFFDPDAELTITHGHLPHWDQQGSTYFITWRTADSIPGPVWEEWRKERNAWLVSHRIDPGRRDGRMHLELLPVTERREFRRFSRLLEDELDRGHGSCVLRPSDLSRIVADALHHFDGDRYALGDFVVMPNHVHVLAGRMPLETMRKQVESWKKWSAIRINNSLGRKARFWQDEHFDHLVRSPESFEKYRRYIASNPGQARLGSGDFNLWQRPVE